jgi:hypothetical protein
MDTLSIGGELVKNFIMGGTIISTVSYLATFISPLVAAIIWSYPFSILPTVYFMKRNGTSNARVSKFLFSTSYALILLIVATVSMGIMMKNDKSVGGLNSILKATGIWAVGAVVLYAAVHATGTAHHFV